MMCNETIMVGDYEADACIAPICQALNDAGIDTVASCCGHGKKDGAIILKDGRELCIKPFSLERAIAEWSVLVSVKDIEAMV